MFLSIRSQHQRLRIVGLMPARASSSRPVVSVAFGSLPKVDLFACNVQVRDELLKLGEAHSSLIGLAGLELAFIGDPKRVATFLRQAFQCHDEPTS
jgi:hypothetical protein